MWVETTDGTLVNLDGAQEVSKWQGRQADDGFNLSVYGFSGDRHWTVDLINRVTEAEIEAALRRIRDALARGEKFVSLREPAHDSDSESDSGEADDPSTYCGRLIRDGRVVVPDWPTAHTVIRQAFNACYVAAVSGGSLQGPFTIRLYERV